MTPRRTPEEAEALREAARLKHRSIQDVARAAIDEDVAMRRRRRSEQLAAIVAEDADLLHRLGSM